MQRQCNSTDNTGHAASVSDSVGQRHKPQHSKKSLEAKDVSLYKPFRAEYSELWIVMGLAFIAAILIAYHRTSKAGLDTDALLTLAIITLTCGLAGSYLLYIFVTYSLSEIWGSIVDGSFSVFKSGGLVFYGGLIVGVLSGWIYLHAKKASFYEYAAVIVPAIPLAHAIGRIGCFLAGCCYGRIVDTPISVYYRNPIGGAPVGVPVFPIQLVESACNILVFVILLIYTRKRLKAGSVLIPLCHSVRH